MQNNASHCLQKQAMQKQNLYSQGQLLLPEVTAALSALTYRDIVHQRLSQQSDSAATYQGLTCAVHNQFNQVMIKWQLSTDKSSDLTSSSASSLEHEASVLQVLNNWQSTPIKSKAIAPSLLESKTITLSIFEFKRSLTLLVMPYYLQGSLTKHLNQELSDVKKYQFIRSIAGLVAQLHSRGWLHNDIKPSNILVSDNYSNKKSVPSLLLTDFALATTIKSPFLHHDTLNHSALKDNALKDNALKDNALKDNALKNSAGTPAYLAPERWQGQGATVQSDIYAIGIMLYEVLVGARPFAIDSSSPDLLKEWAIQHCQQLIPQLPKQYGHYQAIVNQTLAKRVESRYSTMDEILADLDLLGDF